MFKNYLILSILLFSLGLIGAVSRRNIIIIYMSIELMLNAISIMLVSYSSFYNTNTGVVLSIMVTAIAAAEAALFMALFVTLYRKKKSLDTSLFNSLKDTNATK